MIVLYSLLSHRLCVYTLISTVEDLGFLLVDRDEVLNRSHTKMTLNNPLDRCYLVKHRGPISISPLDITTAYIAVEVP